MATLLDALPNGHSVHIRGPKISDKRIIQPARVSIDEGWLLSRLKRKGVFSEVAELTPKLAELLLARNPENRPIRRQIVDNYVADIVNGKWQLNGESIKISDDGQMNDGQHRCAAVIESGKSIHTHFVFGVARCTRGTVDIGTIRTAGNILEMDGVKNSVIAGAVASLIWQYEKFGKISNHSSMRPTKQAVREIYFSHSDEIQESILVSKRGLTSKMGGPSLFAFAHYFFAKEDRAAADYFISKLIVGDELPARDAIFVARNKLLKGRRRISAKGDNMTEETSNLSTRSFTPQERMEVIFGAWKSHRANRSVSKIDVRGRNRNLKKRG